jgi:hypothetical protein
LERLEREIERLKCGRHLEPDPYRPWWREDAGRFANDPEFEEIVRPGREYRRSLGRSETEE